MIPVEARELILAAVELDRFNRVLNPEDYAGMNSDLYMTHDRLRTEIHKAETLLTGLEAGFTLRWEEERKALFSRIEAGGQAPEMDGAQ